MGNVLSKPKESDYGSDQDECDRILQAAEMEAGLERFFFSARASAIGVRLLAPDALRARGPLHHRAAGSRGSRAMLLAAIVRVKRGRTLSVPR